MMLRLLSITIFCALFALTTPSTAIADEKSKLDSIKSKINELRSQLSGSQTKRSRLQEELNDSDKEINALQANINAIINERNDINSSIEDLETRQKNILVEKKELQRTLMQQLVAAYKTGKQSKVKMLLSQKDPQNIGRLLTYHNYLNIAREEQINALQNAIESLKELGEEVKQKTWQLSVNEEKLKREKKVLSEKKSTKAQLLSKINNDISSQSKKIGQLSSDQKNLENLIIKIAQRKAAEQDRIAAEARARAKAKAKAKTNNRAPDIVASATDGSGFAKNKGRMSWPVQGQLKHRYNSIIAGDVRRSGIFIANKEGNSVYAVYGGTVVYADWFQKKGLMTIINHGNGYMSLYAHNQSLLNKEGDKVKAGEKIALSGQSGNISSPGLYFEIRKNGKAFNPSQWLKP